MKAMKALEAGESFWTVIERGAAYADSLPSWMTTGIVLDPVRYTTHVDDGRESVTPVSRATVVDPEEK